MTRISKSLLVQRVEGGAVVLDESTGNEVVIPRDFIKAAAEALGRAAGYPRLCVCRRCGEPLVSTLAVRKKEWVCVVCEQFFEFLAVDYAEGTVALNDRYDELRERWMTEQERILAEMGVRQ